MKKTLLLITASFLAIAVNAQIVITEIMYNPPESGTDSLEFIELYNSGASSVDLDGYTFAQGVTLTFGSTLIVPAGGYAVVALNPTAFQNVFGVAPSAQFSGALSNGGEDIDLKNNLGVTVDYVNYNDASPWPTAANGNGSSLSFCDVSLDNDDGNNWIASTTNTGVTINGKTVLASPFAADIACPSTGIAVSFASSTASQVENITANDTIWINLASVATQKDTINVSLTDITATYGTDYTTTPNVSTATDLYIVSGDSKAMIIVNNIDDAVFEGNETFSVTINSVTSGLSIGTPSTLTYTVIEDEISTSSLPMYSIATVTTGDANGVTDSLSVNCRLTGIVYGENFRASSTGLSFTLIDNTGGIGCFTNPATYGYTVTEGDSIIVEGNIGQFNGFTQIYLDTIILISQGNGLNTPLSVTVLDESTESKLIMLDSVVIVNPAQWNSGVGSGFEVDVTDGTNTYVMRVDNDCNLFNMPIPAYAFSLIGIGGQYDSTSTFLDGYQILPRRDTDIDSIGVYDLPIVVMDATPNCTGNTVVETYMFKDFKDLNISSGGWSNVIVTGTTEWYADDYQGDDYGKISNFVFGTPPSWLAAEAWLISPSLDISGAFSPVVNFLTLSKFDGPQLQLMVSTDYTGAGDPNLATWTDLTASADWDTDLADWGDFVCSGDVGLGAYKSTTTYVAFKYTGTSSNGTTWEVDDIAIFDTDALSIEDELQSDLTVYPNPTNNVLNIDLLSKELSTISILDLSGKSIVSVSTSKLNNSISVESLENGIYFIEVKSKNSIYRTKFIKN